jgi:hypothetical protein
MRTILGGDPCTSSIRDQGTAEACYGLSWPYGYNLLSIVEEMEYINYMGIMPMHSGHGN